MARSYDLSDYFADDGNAYKVYRPWWWQRAGLHRQWDTSYTTGKPTLPPGLIMRHVNLLDSTGKRRRNMPISRVEVGWWPFLGTTCSLPNMDGTFTTWTVVSHNSESYQPLKYRIKRR